MKSTKMAQSTQSVRREAHNLEFRYGEIGISAVVDGRSFAYLTLRDISGNRTLYEFGAHGHGPAGQHLAGQMAAQVRTWGDEHRHSRARFRADPAGTARRLAGLTVRRPHYQITISWPE